MAENEQPQPAVTPTAPASEPVVVPTPEAPSAPVTDSPAPAITENPSPAPTVDAPKPDAVTSVLGDAVKPESKDASKTEAPKTETATTKDEKPVEVTTPVYEFKLPENVTLDKEPMDAFTKLLGEIETGKLDHAGLQEKGQALIEMHTKSLSDSINRLNDYYAQIHEKQKNDWFETFKKDPEIGGEKVESTVKAVRNAIDSFGGNPEQITELRTEMKNSGYGNHPALIRLINNMQQKIDSYTKESPSDKRMVPAARPALTKVKAYQQFYSNGSAQ